MNAREEFVGVVVQVHPTDFRYLEQAAAAMKTGIEDFAALAIYKQSKAALFDMAVPAAEQDHDDGTVPRTSA